MIVRSESSVEDNPPEEQWVSPFPQKTATHMSQQTKAKVAGGEPVCCTSKHCGWLESNPGSPNMAG